MHREWLICNLTPNSFSDGGRLSSIEKLASHLKRWMGVCSVYDFGAESTAPFNEPISIQQEQERFELLLAVIEQYPHYFYNHAISIDTYHPDTFEWLAKKIREVLTDATLIWNDVSGIWEKEIEEILNHHNAYYVFAHTHVPNRQQVSFHMDYIRELSDEDFWPEFKEHFIRVWDKLSSNTAERIIYDPCFGFSKNYQQNWWLLNNIELLFSFFAKRKILLGISRKSFLQNYLGVLGEKRWEEVDQLQRELVNDWLARFAQYNWDIRVHVPVGIE